MIEQSAGASAWMRASLAAAAFAVDPLGTGVIIRGGPGPARDAWLRLLFDILPQDFPLRRIPASIGDERLLGGVDIGATMKAGRPIAEPGVLEQTKGGVIILAMAERVSSRVAARLASALDSDSTPIGLVALDEGYGDDEAPPAILLERCGYMVDLSNVSLRDIEPEDERTIEYAAARTGLPLVSIDPAAVEAFVSVAASMGIASLRAPLTAIRAARAICALDGRTEIEDGDLALAATLTLSPRATRLPEAEPEDEIPPSETDSDRDRERENLADEGASKAVEDVVLAAAKATIPDALLAQFQTGRVARAQAPGEGKSGASQVSSRRGRPIAARAGAPREGRLSVIATLRAAAPWQNLRGRQQPHENPRTVLVRPEDFRIIRFHEPRGATAIFVVDASGSSALHRLAEVKGAIELLLADCYVRRDSVALIAFRGQRAEILLPPTRSTARARRSLAGLPGGGGTPLASGLDAAAALGEQVRRKGQQPLVVLMTDGRANVCRDGAGGRAQARLDALDAARRLRAAEIRALAIDTSARLGGGESGATKEIAEAMHARYVRLPLANASLVNEAVRASWRPSRS